MFKQFIHDIANNIMAINLMIPPNHQTDPVLNNINKMIKEIQQHIATKHIIDISNIQTYLINLYYQVQIIYNLNIFTSDITQILHKTITHIIIYQYLYSVPLVNNNIMIFDINKYNNKTNIMLCLVHLADINAIYSIHNDIIYVNNNDISIYNKLTIFITLYNNEFKTNIVISKLQDGQYNITS